MRSAVSGGYSMVIEFLPLAQIVIKQKGIASDDIFAGITNGPPEEDSLVLADRSDGMAETG